MNIYYLIDTSGSMNHNGCIQSVNTAMPEIIEILSDVTLNNKDHGDIYMSCITFSDHARAIDNHPISSLEYCWNPLEAGGLTNMAEAFELLDKQMLTDAADSTARYLRPAVILLSDGDPDSGWEESLKKLEANPMYRNAYKIAIAIGAGGNNVTMRRALTRFAAREDGGAPNIISVSDLNRLTEVIRVVSATVSQVGSRTAANGIKGNNDPVESELHRRISEDLDPIDGVQFAAIGTDGEYWN